jgi:hypothetical protein
MELIKVKLFHRTKNEICLRIGDEMFLFLKENSESEYEIGERLWGVIEACSVYIQRGE